MKEKLFRKLFGSRKKVTIPIYWSVDDEGDVLLDDEAMRQEFEDVIQNLEEEISG